MGTRTRSSVLPELPTIDESGLSAFEAEQRYGLLAPRGTPAAIVAKINSALRDALASADVKARIAADGPEPAPSTPEEYALDIGGEETK